jgi:UrcA family protein
MTMDATNTFPGNRINCFILAALATAFLAVTSTAVHAADISGSELMKRTVTYGDLNLANPQGVEQLYQRVVSAAQQVCDSLDGRSLQEKVQFSICVRQSIARAVAVVDQPALTALHAIKTGQPESMARLARNSR